MVSAEAGHVVGVQRRVVGDERQALDARLGDEHTVERVGVVARRPAGLLCVARADVSLAALEAFVHLDGEDTPADLVVIPVEIPGLRRRA